MGRIDRGVVMVDEGGEVEYEGLVELKGVWKGREGWCGWYMMGGEGLKEKKVFL